MRQLLPRALVLATALAVIAAAAPAHADDRTDAEALFRAGEKAFDAAQYAAAADAFEQAYAKLPLPAIAFSTAQAHRLQYFVDNQAAHLERAAKLYHAYIDATKAGGRVADAVANLAQIEPLLSGLGKSGAAGGEAPVAGATRLVVIADVAGARATIDEATGPVPFVHDVAVGEHAITVAADGYETLTRRVTAVQGEMVPVEAQLVAKPALVAVRGPAGAAIAVDRRDVGTAPLAGITVPAGRHLIEIDARGHVPFVRDVDLARGQRLELAPELAPTRQRRAVPFVLGAAGVMLVGAGVAAYYAHSSLRDGDAQGALLRAGDADASVLAKYTQDVADRSARVHDTELFAGGAGALLVTAALLYVFDHPTAEAPPITPLVGTRAAGVSIGGTF